jgi:hypothetical protein
LQEFDTIQEGELSRLTRLATEREDNMMWKEFREALLRNIGLVRAAAAACARVISCGHMQTKTL